VSVSPKDEIWFLRVCHHISTGLCVSENAGSLFCVGQTVRLLFLAPEGLCVV